MSELAFSMPVIGQLLSILCSHSLKQKLEIFKIRILLLWVNIHFTELLDSFETRLETAKMLNFACAAKARPRTVVVTR